MADVQTPVRLRREPGHDLRVCLGSKARVDDVANKIAPRLRRLCHCQFRSHSFVPRPENPRPLLPNSLQRAKPTSLTEPLVMYRSCYTPPPALPTPTEPNG